MWLWTPCSCTSGSRSFGERITSSLFVFISTPLSLSLSHSLPLLYSPHWLLLRVRPPAGPAAHFKLKCVRFFWELPHRFFRWNIVYLFYVLLSKRVQSHLLRLFLGYVNLPRSHRWNNATYRMSLCTWATKKRMLMKSSLELHPRVLKTDASS